MSCSLVQVLLFAALNPGYFMFNVGGENKWWFGLIEEHEKTEEYKQWSEERLQRHLEKEVRYQRMLKDLEEMENEEDA
jgi:hypothetical protein